MSDVEKPTLLILLTVLVIINSVFCIIGGIILIYSFIAGFQNIGSLLLGIFYSGAGLVGVTAGIMTANDRVTGSSLIKIFAFYNLSFNIIWLIYDLAVNMRPSWGSIIINCVISAVALAYLYLNTDARQYNKSIR